MFRITVPFRHHAGALAMLVAAAACNDAIQPDARLNPRADGGVVGEQGPSVQVGSGPPVGLTLMADKLVHPVALAEAPDSTGRLFIVDQTGVIQIRLPNGTLLTQPFLDVRSRMTPLMPSYDERGLLGLAFHPNFRTNGKFYVFYTRPPRVSGWDNTSTVSEFLVSSNPNLADPASERVVLQEDHPQFNHDGGTIAFGPEGFLYISIGDGGGANDVDIGHVADWYAFNDGGNGQDVTSNRMGNVLRIDVDGGIPYAIPSDNPFVGKPGLDEIWAYGFRNPYRFSFDRGGTHQLFLGDAGQNLWEEADIVTKGGNYGWNVKEGKHCFDAADPFTIPASCPSVDTETGDPLIDPIIEIPNEANANEPRGIAVIVGGFMYRGSEVPALVGQYVYGAYAEDDAAPTGAILASAPRPSGLWAVKILPIATKRTGQLNHFLLGFGEDLHGELYVLVTESGGLTGTSGKVFKITSPTGGTSK